MLNSFIQINPGETLHKKCRSYFEVNSVEVQMTQSKTNNTHYLQSIHVFVGFIEELPRTY